MLVNEDARRRVIFFGVPTERAALHYGGTGFLVAFEEEGIHVVTCRHVAKALESYNDIGGIHIRMNTKADGAIDVPVSSDDARRRADRMRRGMSASGHVWTSGNRGRVISIPVTAIRA